MSKKSITMKKKNHQRVPSIRYIKTSFFLPRSKKEQASQLRFILGKQAYQEQVVAQELHAMEQHRFAREEADAVLQKMMSRLSDPFPSAEEIESLEQLAERALQEGKTFVLFKEEELIIINPILLE